jgi:[acyl-carrier-protein] S-malonyltransferase
VRFRESIHAMRALGAEDFVELGPGRVLTGLVKRILREEAVA